MITEANVSVLTLDEDNRPFLFSLAVNKEANIKCSMPTNAEGQNEINLFCVGEDELDMLKTTLGEWLKVIDEYYNNLNKK